MCGQYICVGKLPKAEKDLSEKTREEYQMLTQGQTGRPIIHSALGKLVRRALHQ